MRKTRGRGTPLPGTILLALGVVYGDIGTSPIYTLKECFGAFLGIEPTHDNLLGILSLILWGLILVVSLKYLAFVLRADNNGEGGVLALLALTRRVITARSVWLLPLGLIGAGLFYGDGVITPAISVLSAIEGLKVATPAFHPYIIPLTLLVLFGLFALQAKGTAQVGDIFGPIMMLWFACLGISGAVSVVARPEVLAAFNPLWALGFFSAHGLTGFLALGSVVLAMTGAEALYADMGHFGRRPIRIAWYVYVLPALMLNYLGQGALILHNPAARSNPFFRLMPPVLLIPTVLLATVATVIASQAVISGVFSLTRQAINMGYLPRMKVRFTSEQEMGQIYIPLVNWTLFAVVICVVLIFQSSSALAGAYGIAVTSTMIITTLLTCKIAYRRWRWSLWVVLPLMVAMLAIDIPLFSANLVKVLTGGWLSLLIGFCAFGVMAIWFRGRLLIYRRINEASVSFDDLLSDLRDSPPLIVGGTAVFMTHMLNGVPRSLIHNLKLNHILHERNFFLTIRIDDVPHVPLGERVELEECSDRFWRIRATYGFRETPDVQEILSLCEDKGVKFDFGQTSFFLSRGNIVQIKHPGMMSRWWGRLFVWLHRNEMRAIDFLRIPTDRVMEMGVRIKL